MENAGINFRCCRACLLPVVAPRLEWDFFNLNYANGEYAEKVKLISGIDFSNDAGKHDAFMCRRCFMDLERAFEFRQKIIESETRYFEPRRVEFNIANLPLVLEIEIGTEEFEDQASDNSDEIKLDKDENEDLILRYKNELQSHFENAHENKSHLSETVNKEESKSSCVTVKDKVSKKKFKCSICHKMLINSQVLRHHIEAIHAKLKIYACDKCPMKCYHKQDLLRHVINHVKKPNFMPRQSTTDSNRPFECDHKSCGKFFKARKHLRRHKKVHSDVRPFVCWCGNAYKLRYNWRSHVRRIHNNIIS